MKTRASERGWDILFRYVQARARPGPANPEADPAPDETEERLEAQAEAARKLLKDPAFQRLRLEALEEIVSDFAAWLGLDPSGPNYDRELRGIHLRAAPRYWALFRPEEIIGDAAQASRRKAKEA